MYHILIFTVVSPLGQECREKYYGHEVTMKLHTGCAVLSQIIYALQSLEPGTLMQETSEIIK